MDPRKDYIYLDHNATSVVRPEVCSKMLASYGGPHNASSTHAMGRAAKGFLEEARAFLSRYIDCEINNVFFTSGGTESNNMVLQSSRWEQIFCSSTEHDSVYRGPISHFIPVLSSGIIDIEALELLLKGKGDKRTLVSIHWANNETGVIQPIEEISKIVHRYHAWIHVDGVQVLGKIPFSFRKTEIDFLSLSAHKMGGPQGAGALIAKEELLVPLFFGGGQERSLRAGTENIAAIVGFGEAICQIDLGIFEKLEAQHRDLEKELLEFSQGHGRPLSIIGKNAPRLPNTTCLTMPEVPNQSQLIYFDLKGIGVSIGSACSSRTVKPSRILRNMNLSEDIVRSAIRISSGWNTRESDFLEFKEAWKFLFLKHIQNQKM